MPIKLLRLGFTECTLLFIYWINEFQNDNNTIICDAKKNLIKWLYTTSGYYDKTITSSYMNATHLSNDTIIYKKYMNLLLNFVENADFFIPVIFDDIIGKNVQHYNNFKKTIKSKKEIYISQDDVYKFIENKNILIISPFSPLIKQQIESGNVKKIYPNMSDVNNIIIYKNIYTFFNTGPDNNIFETAHKIMEDIKQIKDDYDSVLISCGAYSFIFGNELFNMGKNICVVGGEFQGFFGIFNNRMTQLNSNALNEIPNKEYWILNVPSEYKPKDYMKIENGCYW